MSGPYINNSCLRRSLGMKTSIKNALSVCTLATASLTLATPAQALTCGIFAFEGGSSIINSGTSMTGDVCYSKNVTSTTNSKLPKSGDSIDFDGGAYVHSTATFSYQSKDFLPNDGIFTSGYDATLEGIDAAYKATATYYQGQTADQTISSIWSADQTFNTSNGTADTTIINFTSAGGIGFNSNTLSLTGDSNDKFIFNFADGANFDWAQSQTILGGITADNILFNFWGTVGGSSTINKDTTIFKGTILAPNLDSDFIYHNPASFEGAIFANMINVHSDFNLTTNAFSPVPVPAAVWLFGSGLLGLVGVARRKKA